MAENQAWLARKIPPKTPLGYYYFSWTWFHTKFCLTLDVGLAFLIISEHPWLWYTFPKCKLFGENWKMCKKYSGNKRIILLFESINFEDTLKKIVIWCSAEGRAPTYYRSQWCWNTYKKARLLPNLWITLKLPHFMGQMLKNDRKNILAFMNHLKVATFHGANVEK